MGYSLGFAWDEIFDPQYHPEPYNKAVHGVKKVAIDRYDRSKFVKARIKWLFRVVYVLR